jgi:hypothetical protein
VAGVEPEEGPKDAEEEVDRARRSRRAVRLLAEELDERDEVPFGEAVEVESLRCESPPSVTERKRIGAERPNREPSGRGRVEELVHDGDLAALLIREAVR